MMYGDAGDGDGDGDDAALLVTTTATALASAHSETLAVLGDGDVEAQQQRGDERGDADADTAQRRQRRRRRRRRQRRRQRRQQRQQRDAERTAGAALPPPEALPWRVRARAWLANFVSGITPARVAFVALMAALLAVPVVLVQQRKMGALLHAVQRWGVRGVPLLLLAYAAMGCIPIGAGYSLLAIGAGYVFGLVGGVGVAALGGHVGCVTGFLLFRYAVRGWVEARIDGAEDSTPRVLVELVNSHVHKFAFVLRMCPVPYGLSNAIFAVSDISLLAFVTLSAWGLMPEMLMLVYVGTTLNDLQQVLEGTKKLTVGQIVFMVAQVTILTVVMIVAGVLARRALTKAKLERAQRLEQEQAAHDHRDDDDDDDDDDDEFLDDDDDDDDDDDRHTSAASASNDDAHNDAG